jgi:hypothetical protein
MLGGDVVRRLTVVATDNGLTTLKQKLDAVDRAQDRVAVSSTRMGRATEAAERRVQAITAQGGGMLGGLAGRAGAEVLGHIARLVPAALAAYGAFKLLNETWSQGVALLEKYGIAGQRAMFRGQEVDEELKKLTRFQTDTISLEQIQRATELGDRLDLAKQTLNQFFKLQLDLTDPALKLQGVWVGIVELLAKAVELASQLPGAGEGPRADAGFQNWWARTFPGDKTATFPGDISGQNVGAPAAQNAAELMRLARGRLSAGLGGGFPGRFAGILPPKEEKEKAAPRTAFDRTLDSVSKSIALQEADAAAVGKNAGEHARLRVEAQLLEAALRSGLNPETVKASEQFQDLAARAEGAANALAKAKLNSDIRFERDQLGRSDTEAAVASRLRGAGLPVDLQSAEAGMIRFNEQLKMGKELTTDFAVGLGRDFRGALRAGAKGWEAFGEAGINALTRLSDKLIDMATQNLVAQAFGGSSGGGGIFSLFSSFFGGSGGAGGGNTILHNPGGFSAAFPAPVAHGGGVIGQTAFPTRYVHPAYFENAPRFHMGSDEVPAILQKGERVIPAGQNSNQAPVVVQMTLVNDFRGADANAVSGLSVKLDRLKAQIPDMAVAAFERARMLQPGKTR